MFFKKKISQKQKEKPKIPINDVILDDRLCKFKNKVQKISKDEASASLLARQLSRLVRANKFLTFFLRAKNLNNFIICFYISTFYQIDTVRYSRKNRL